MTEILSKVSEPTLAYTCFGEGPAVLLIHGCTMWSDMWHINGVVDAVASNYKLIVPDLRGHGKSTKPHDPKHYGMAMLRDLVEILDSENVEKVHLVGFSTGAEIALKLATSSPDRVASMFVIGAGWSGPEILPSYRELVDWARESGAAQTPNPDYDALDALVEKMSEIVDVQRNEIEGIKVPSAGIVGSEDPDMSTLQRLVGVLSGFELEIIPGANHGTSWPDPIIPVRVKGFLDKMS